MMKKILTVIVLAVSSLMTYGQDRALVIECANNELDMVTTNEVDSIYFSPDGASLFVVANDTIVQFAKSDIVSLSYGEVATKMTVTYEGGKAKVVNPYFTKGVKATVSGAHVTVDNVNADTEYTIQLAGTTTNGSFTYNAAYKTTIELNGVSITNPTGPAIDLECGKRIALELKKGTDNVLVDGTGDHKAAFYCKGHLEVDKSGNLTVTGNAKHAIATKEYLQIKNGVGNINVLSAKGDGIHAGQYYQQNGGSINIKNVAGDGIQAEATSNADDELNGQLIINGGTIEVNVTADDCDAIKADGMVTIANTKSVPVITLTASGAAAKGINSNADINISDGSIIIINSGGGLTEGSDASTAKGIGSDTNIVITGGDINIKMTGAGGKGIKADGTLTIGDKASGEGPKLTVSTSGSAYSSGTTGGTTGGNTGGWGRPGGGGPGGGMQPGGGSSSGSSAKAIKAMGAIYVYGGESNVTTSTSGAEGMESKTSVNIAGGHHYFKCYDDCINSKGNITFDGGITVCYATNNDAVDSNAGRTGAITIGNGVVLAYTSAGSPEEGLDCDNNSYIQITGTGYAISAGGAQGGGSSSSTISNAKQGYAFVTSSISYTAGRYYTLADASGNNLITYKFEGNVNSTLALFTAKGMVKNSSYTVKYATAEPTDATESFHGVYLGSTAKGTTSVTTITAK